MTELGLGDQAATEKLKEGQAASTQDDAERAVDGDIGSTFETVIYSIDYAAEVLGDLLD